MEMVPFICVITCKSWKIARQIVESICAVFEFLVQCDHLKVQMGRRGE